MKKSSSAADARENVQAILASKSPVTRLLRVHCDPGSYEQNRRVAVAEVDSIAKAETPYGSVVQSFEIGSDVTRRVQFIHPAALLWKACELSNPFGRFLVESLGGAAGEVILYMDMTTPGNLHRPDAGRSYHAIYWTLLQYPEWFRNSKDLGWTPLAFVLEFDMSDTGTTPAEVMKNVMRVF